MSAFENLGACCSYSSCQIYDFLPLNCDFCSKKFCAGHAAPSMHGCASCVKPETAVCRECKCLIKGVGRDGLEHSIRTHENSEECRKNIQYTLSMASTRHACAQKMMNPHQEQEKPVTSRDRLTSNKLGTKRGTGKPNKSRCQKRCHVM